MSGKQTMSQVRRFLFAGALFLVLGLGGCVYGPPYYGYPGYAYYGYYGAPTVSGSIFVGGGWWGYPHWRYGYGGWWHGPGCCWR